MYRYLLSAIWLFCLPLWAWAQSTAKGNVVSYNELTATLVLDLNESDLRFNQIDPAGGVVSLTLGEQTRQAYLLPAALAAPETSGDKRNALRLVGFDPAVDGIDLVLYVGRQSSTLAHVDGSQNPQETFAAQTGDELRLDVVAGMPSPQAQEAQAAVLLTEYNGETRLDLSPEHADQLGIFPGVGGTLELNGQSATFFAVSPETLFTAPPADVYLIPQESEGIRYLYLIPPPDARQTLHIANTFALQPGSPVVFHYTGFDYGGDAGRVVDIQDNGQQLLTDIPASTLDEMGVGLGGYVVVSVNGITRAALVMDEMLFVGAFERGGLRSNYILLRQTGILKIIYMLEDGRSAQSIFAAERGAAVRLRPAQATETITRGEAVVKAVAEIAPEGFLYTDITPYELSFLAVVVGEYVDVQLNGITYRARLVDENLLARLQQDTATSDDILVFPNRDHTIITHSFENILSAEERFQASVGDAVVIYPAPN